MATNLYNRAVRLLSDTDQAIAEAKSIIARCGPDWYEAVKDLAELQQTAEGIEELLSLKGDADNW